MSSSSSSSSVRIPKATSSNNDERSSRGDALGGQDFIYSQKSGVTELFMIPWTRISPPERCE